MAKKFKDSKRVSTIYKKLKPLLKEKNKSWDVGLFINMLVVVSNIKEDKVKKYINE